MAERQSYSEQNYFSIDSYPYGRSYGQWTVEWWRWFLSTPKSINPVLDRSGKYAAVNQPPSDVWFLAGKLGDEDSDLPFRFCSIPKGRSILFPIINCQANFLQDPELKTEREIIDHVTTDENTIVEKVCILDDKPIPAQRVKSDPLLFEFTINEDNIYNLQGANSTIAHGDGYWVFLKPLSTGIHKLSFQGSCEKGRLKSGANYKLEVKDH